MTRQIVLYATTLPVYHKIGAGLPVPSMYVMRLLGHSARRGERTQIRLPVGIRKNYET